MEEERVCCKRGPNRRANKVDGRNKVNETLKAIAKLCGHSDRKRCTARGRRAQGISLVANTNVGPGRVMCQLVLVLLLGGHSSLKMVAKYHRPDQLAGDTAARAKRDSPAKIGAVLRCVKEGDSSHAPFSQRASLLLDSISRFGPSLLPVLLFWGRTNLRLFLGWFPLTFASKSKSSSPSVVCEGTVVLRVRYART